MNGNNYSVFLFHQMTIATLKIQWNLGWLGRNKKTHPPLLLFQHLWHTICKRRGRVMTKVEVKPSVLQWAMKRADRLDKLKDQFPHIDKWISQESQPTLKQLEKLAEATSIPLGYLFLPSPPEEKLSIPHYRTVKDEGAAQPSPNLLETVQTMERRQQWMRDYLL